VRLKGLQMTQRFEVAFTADFLADGQLVFKDIGLELLSANQAIRYRFLEPEATLSARQLHNLDALVCLAPKITIDSLSQADRLVAVARFGVGYDSVDVNACTEADVALFIAAGAVNYSVAEAILGWMLALGHHLKQKDQLVREGRWNEKSHWMGSEIRHKVVGLVGVGGIGGTLAGLLHPFRAAEIIAFDPYVNAARAQQLMVRLVSLGKLLSLSDYVVICCPLTNETRNLLGAPELALMKRSAYLVNAARGGIVNEDALIETLKMKQIAGAAVDVFASEPVTARHPLCQFDNVILAPHAIAWTDELFAEIGQKCCEQVLSLFSGQVPGGLVNKEVVGRTGFQEKLRRFQQEGS
jgi:phosphoglycerate dehydrogenase-like enzyme